MRKPGQLIKKHVWYNPNRVCDVIYIKVRQSIETL